MCGRKLRSECPNVRAKYGMNVIMYVPRRTKHLLFTSVVAVSPGQSSRMRWQRRAAAERLAWLQCLSVHAGVRARVRAACTT
jgi:hypothetical protein